MARTPYLLPALILMATLSIGQERREPAAAEPKAPAADETREARRESPIRRRVRISPREEPGDEARIEQSEVRTARITKGTIQVTRLLEYLASISDVPVIYDEVSSATYFRDKAVSILAETEATFENLKAILGVNGYLVCKHRGYGPMVIEVIYARSPAGSSSVATRLALPLIGMEPDPATEDDLHPDEIVTLVARLEHADANEMFTTLQGHMLSSGRGRASAIHSITRDRSSNTLLVTLLYREVPGLRALIRKFDVGPERGEWIVEIIDVKNMPAGDLASVIRQMLQIHEEGPGAPETSEGREAGKNAGTVLPPAARVIPVPAGNRLVVVARSRDELRRIRDWIERIDAKTRDTTEKPDEAAGRPGRTHIFQLKHIEAIKAAELLNSKMGGPTSGSARSRRGGRGAGPIRETSISIVPHEDTNSLLIQGNPDQIEFLRKLIEMIDREEDTGEETEE